MRWKQGRDAHLERKRMGLVSRSSLKRRLSYLYRSVLQGLCLPSGQLSDLFFHTWLTLGTSPGCACTPQPLRIWTWRLLGGARLNIFIVIQSLIRVQLFVTLWTAERQASLPFTIARILTGGCWNPPKKKKRKKKDTQCHRTREKPQRDCRRGTITLKSNPIPTRWMTHNGE